MMCVYYLFKLYNSQWHLKLCHNSGSWATGLESKLPFHCCAALLLCNISAQFHNFAECEPVPTQQWLQHFKLMLLPLLFYQELYNSCPPVLQSEIQIISLLGGTIEISMNLTLCHWYWHRLFYTDCGKTAYCKTQQKKTNHQPGFHSSSMVSLWCGVPE